MVERGRLTKSFGNYQCARGGKPRYKTSSRGTQKKEAKARNAPGSRLMDWKATFNVYLLNLDCGSIFYSLCPLLTPTTLLLLWLTYIPINPYLRCWRKWSHWYLRATSASCWLSGTGLIIWNLLYHATQANSEIMSFHPYLCLLYLQYYVSTTLTYLTLDLGNRSLVHMHVTGSHLWLHPPDAAFGLYLTGT